MTTSPAAPAEPGGDYEVLHALAGSLWTWHTAAGGRPFERIARVGVSVPGRSSDTETWPIALTPYGVAALCALLADDAAARTGGADEAEQAGAAVQEMCAVLVGCGRALAAAAAAGDPRAWEVAAGEVAELAARVRLTARSAKPPQEIGQGELFDVGQQHVDEHDGLRRGES